MTTRPRLESDDDRLGRLQLQNANQKRRATPRAQALLRGAERAEAAKAYLALRDRLKTWLFSVRLDLPAKRMLKTSQKRMTSNLSACRAESGLPAPENVPPPDKVELYVKVYETYAIMRAVYHRSRERSVRKSSLMSKTWFDGKVSDEASDDNARRLYIEFRDHGTIALLIGLLCGFSERALATAITGRAAAFVRTVQG